MGAVTAVLAEKPTNARSRVGHAIGRERHQERSRRRPRRVGVLMASAQQAESSKVSRTMAVDAQPLPSTFASRRVATRPQGAEQTDLARQAVNPFEQAHPSQEPTHKRSSGSVA